MNEILYNVELSYPHMWGINHLNVAFFEKRFYLFFTEGKRRRKKGRIINAWLPLALPLLGTWPATQACALRLEPATLWFTGQHSTTEPHQSGLNVALYFM